MEEDFIFNFSTDDFGIEDPNLEDEQPLEGEENYDNTKENNPVEDESSEEVDGKDNNKEDGDDDAPDGADEESSSDIYSSLASFAQDQGILSSSLDLSQYNIKSADDLAELINHEVSTRTKHHIDERISNIDLNKIAQYKNEIDNISSLTMHDFKENLDLAKRTIEQDLINQNLPERVVKNYMRRLVGSEEDVIIEEAMSSKDSIVSFNKLREEEEYNRYEVERQENFKRAEKDLKTLQTAIYDNKEILPGFIPNKTVRDRVYSHITNVVGEDANGNPITQLVKDSYEDPIGFQIRLHTMYELTDGFRNIDKIGARQKSNAIKDLENAFKDGRPNYSGGASYKVDKNSYEGSALKYDELNI